MLPEFDKDRTFDPVSAYGTERWVAATLGSSVDWLKKNRPRLETEGLPAVDKLIGLTLKADVEAFLAKRRRVPDAVAVSDNHDSRFTGVNLDAL